MTIKIFKFTPKLGVQCIKIDSDSWYDYQKTVWVLHKQIHTIYVRASRSKLGTKAGFTSLHRLIMKAHEEIFVDHENGNGLDNRRCNLRLCTKHQNNMNAKKRVNAITSKYRGTHFNSKLQKWIAQIQLNKTKKYLGCFLTEIEAAKAYNIAAQLLHGEFAKLNVIKDDSHD